MVNYQLWVGFAVGGGAFVFGCCRLSYRHSRPHRHSRESGNPPLAYQTRRGIPGFWIPAGAGMTVGRCEMMGYG